MPSCSTCRAWHPTAGSRVEHGTCRFNPPTVQSGVTEWPVTHGTRDWCMEYQAELAKQPGNYPGKVTPI